MPGARRSRPERTAAPEPHRLDATRGGAFTHHGSFELGDLRFRFGWVHPRHFDLGTFAWWGPVVAEVHPDARRAALQVLPPPDLLRTPRRWRLSQPHPLG